MEGGYIYSMFPSKGNMQGKGHRLEDTFYRFIDTLLYNESSFSLNT